VSREDDVDPELSLLFDDIAGPGAFYVLERYFWLELWRVPVLEAVDECRIEARHYGPIRAFALAGEPRTPLFNLVLGADRPGAIEDGHLAEALDWTESLGLDCRVPLRADVEFGEPGAAEDHLNRRAYRRTGTLAMFARAAGPAGFPSPSGIEIEEVTDESRSETFSSLLAPAYGLPWTGHGFIFGLPGRRDWRSYIAIDESQGPIGAATMMMHYEAPQLGFAGTVEEGRGRGAHMALLHRRIEDARAVGAGQLFSVTEESLDCPDELSPGARNLLRAGFGLVGARTVWQPPEDAIAPLPADEEDDGPDFRLGA
jgi:hypothetical protein